MAKEDTDYNPAIRKEIKADAETGRTFKKWKHRAQGAAAGTAIGTVAGVLAGRKLRRSLGATTPRLMSMASILGVTEFGAPPATRPSAIIGWARSPSGKAALKKHGSNSRAAIQSLQKKNGRALPMLRNGLKEARAEGRSDFSVANALGITNLSLGSGFKDMLESSVRLKKLHMKKWKEMDPKAKEANRAEMRVHRQALSEVEGADNPFGYSTTNYGMLAQLTNLECGEVECGVERHPKDLPLDIATLRKKKLNAGQTGQQKPGFIPDPILKIKSYDGRMTGMGDRRSFTNFAIDSHGRPHSGSGTFEPEIDGISPQQIHRAYNPSPKVRLTGRSPVKSGIQKQIMRRALARVGTILTL